MKYPHRFYKGQNKPIEGEIVWMFKEGITVDDFADLEWGEE